MTTPVEVWRTDAQRLLPAWRAAFEAARERFAARPAHQYDALIVGLIEALAIAADGQFVIGSASSREVERAAAFAGAHLAPEGATAFDLKALYGALAQTLAESVALQWRQAFVALLDWLAIVSADALAQAKTQAIAERVDDELAAGTPLVPLAAGVVGLWLVGSPSTRVLAALAERAVMTAVAGSASTLIIDVSGLGEQGCARLAAFAQEIARHHLRALTYMVVGPAKSARVLHATWAEVGLSVTHAADFSVVFRDALVRAGYTIMARP